MPPRTPQGRQKTDMSANTESNTSKTSNPKRKSTASATTPNTEPKHAKKAKADLKSTTKHNESKPEGSGSLYVSIIMVKVGKDEVTLPIHRELLRSASRFFREILPKNETAEDSSSPQERILKDEDPRVIRRFCDWLYTGEIISGRETNKDLPWSEIIAVYSFGHRKGSPRLQNHCVDTVIRKRQEEGLFPSQADVNTLWKASGPFFRFRRLLLDMFATECNLRSAIAHNGSYHAKFLQGLVQTLFELKQKGTIYDEIDFWKRRQIYYVEDDENPLLLD